MVGSCHQLIRLPGVPWKTMSGKPFGSPHSATASVRPSGVGIRCSRCSGIAIRSAVMAVLQDALEGRHEQVRMLPLEYERRPNLERVSVTTGGPDQDARVSHPFDDLLRRCGVRFGRSRPNDLDADREADAADLADERRT